MPDRMADHRRRTLTDEERLDWLRLIRSTNVGPGNFFRLLERFGTAGKALEAIPDLAHHGGRAGGEAEGQTESGKASSHLIILRYGRSARDATNGVSGGRRVG